MESPMRPDSLTNEELEDTVPLSDILSVRDKCLQELELWALCRECCLLLEYVQDSVEMFQAVSITPETIGFDSQGNLCFLYLDSTDPEPLFLPPEIEDGSDKEMGAHLYSLGMTMLYAAEYNSQLTSLPDRGKMSGTLSRLVGRMTADNPADRPSMDSVIASCDKMLASESSQDICVDVASICRMKPLQDADARSYDGPTLAEINRQLEAGHVNGVPVWNHSEGISQDSDNELADVFSKIKLNNSSNQSKELVDPNLTTDGILYSSSTAPNDSSHENTSQVDLSVSHNLQYTDTTCQVISEKQDPSPAPRKVHENHYHNGNGLLLLEDDSLLSDSFDLTADYLTDQCDMEHSRKMSQSQGVTLAEVLEKKDGYLQEAELWAVCRESIQALQKLKKRLPAYISPDTLILREEGIVSFKAIPEDKPLEVLFMAPELQTKGLLSQKTCLYGLAITLRCASGKKFSQSNSSLSREMDALLQSMVNKDLDRRPPLTEVLAICADHEQLSDVPSQAICQFMFQDTATAMMESKKRTVKPPEGSSDKDSSHDVNGKMVKSDRNQSQTSGKNEMNISAFRPVSGTLSTPNIGKDIKRIPSKYSSSATHFTPIVLHHSNNESSPVNSGKKEQGKETEVVKKLKELKENLMKPRNSSNKENDSNRNVNSKTATPVKTEPVSTEKTANQVSLETIAHLLQNQGQLAQLNMLAATIAQLLQTSAYSNNNTTSVENQNIAGPIKGHVPLTANMRLPSLDLPRQYQDEIVGQTVTMPVQGNTGLVSNIPVQLQLQHDPNTGLIQLVPVGFLSTTVQSRSSDTDSSTSQSREGSRAGRYSSNRQYASDSPNVRHSDIEVTPRKPPRSKPYKAKSKETSTTVNEDSNLRRVQSEHNLAQITPDNTSPSVQTFQPPGYRTGSIPNLVSNASASCIVPVYDDGVVSNGRTHPVGKQSHSYTPGTSYNGVSNDTRNGPTKHVSPTESHSSSPSPSKDSGVSGVNSGGGNNYNKSDVTLMDRLLGQDSLRQQQILQAVVDILRLAFSQNSDLESGGEDYIMGEYISSLAGLKWETFKCAIEEKYMEFLWSPDVLSDLHSTVNGKSLKRCLDMDDSTSQVLEVSGEPVVSSTPRSHATVKPNLSVSKSDSKMSSSSVETNQSSGVKSDTAIRDPYYRYSPTPRGGLHRFNPSRNLCNQGADTCTSDSTDTSETLDRKRRYKKRHQHNRSKTSSVQSSPLTPIDQGKETNNNEHKLDTSEEKSNCINQPCSRVINDQTDQDKSTLHRLSEKSGSEDPVGNNTSPVVLDDKDLDPPVLYSVSMGRYSDNEGPPLQFTSTPYNLAQQGRAACIDRQESFNNGSIIKQLSYESSTCENGETGQDIVTAKRKDSISSSSSQQSKKHVRMSDQGESKNISPRTSRQGDEIHRNRGNVVYHSAELQYCMTPQLDHVIQELDPNNEANLRKRKAHLDQQVMMERRTKKKMQSFYKKLIIGGKPIRGDQKNMFAQVSKDIKDMTSRLKFMELAWSHVEMLLSELNGIHPVLLHSLLDHPADGPLNLRETFQNPPLQFQTLHDSSSGLNVRVLQAGSPDGLLAYLYSLSSLSDGYIHQFLYTFRYFASQTYILDFFMDKYIAAKRNSSSSLNERVMRRSVDLLYYWLEGYYCVDFQFDSQLTERLQDFIINQVTFPEGYGASLLGLLQDCNHGNNMELSFTSAIVTDQVDLQLREDLNFSPKKKSDGLQLPGFKAIVKSSPMKTSNPTIISSAMLDNRYPGNSLQDTYIPHKVRRSDAFIITDYTSQSLAQQLSLMQQDLFQKCHPVHFLNTRAQGIGVALNSSSIISANRSRSSLNASEMSDGGLFEGSFHPQPVLQRLIKSAQEIAHWVAAEIVSCSTVKSQLSVLTSFISCAQLCMQMRNFATSLAISDGLENLIVRQLPVWKSLPSKYISIKEELTSLKMLLKNEPMCLLEEKEFRNHPSIPSILLFIMHVQQLEIGSFQLANGMYKWQKLRSIAQTVDQIRMFRDQKFPFEEDSDFQDLLRQRIHDMSCQDLQELASQHDTNYYRVSSRGLFSKMKGKFQSKGDKS